jgi:glycogen operon protein
MLLMGDELGRTQQGNNNTYCQDNELSWVDWDLDQARQELLDFTRLATRSFQQHPALRRRKFFQGRKIRGSEVKDLTWFRPDGDEMTEEDWTNPETRCLGLRLAGDAIDEMDERGNRLVDDTLLVLLNAHHEPVPFVLPAHRPKLQWELIRDTQEASGTRDMPPMPGGDAYELEARSLAVLRLVQEAEAERR